MNKVGRIPARPVGVYADVPFEEYLRWDAVSQSGLGELLRSPAHMKASIESLDVSDSDALRIGRAVHCAVLEPDAFAGSARFGVLPDGTDFRTTAGKALRDKIKASGATAIKQPEYDKVCAMRDALFAHSAAGKLLKSDGPTELSLVWVDEATGVLCKARHDKHAASIGGGVILDVKSTVDASAEEFAKSVYNFGYHRQGAFYLRGASALDLPVAHYAILAVEKEAPYAVAVFRLMEAALDAGDDEVGALLARYKRCEERGEWPAYPSTVQDLALPDWAWAKTDRLTVELAKEASADLEGASS